MKRKLLISLALALLVTLAFSVPAFAWGGDVDADVELSDIAVEGRKVEGSSITVSGTVTITAEADTYGFIPTSSAESDASHSVVNHRGDVVDSGSSSVSDSDIGFFYTSSDASQVYEWSTTIDSITPGEWTASHEGHAWAEANKFLLWCSISDEAWASALVNFVITPKDETQWFTVVLPDGKLKVKRKGTVRYGDIDFNDGTWRVQIPARVQIWNEGAGNGAAEKLILNDDGSIWNNITFPDGTIQISKV